MFSSRRYVKKWQHQSQVQINILTWSNFIVTFLSIIGSLYHSTLTVSAFTPPVDLIYKIERIMNINRPVNSFCERRTTPHSPLLQASLLGTEPEDNEVQKRILSWIKSKLPPPPEDRITISGDIIAIFFYSWMDHSVNSWYDSMLNEPQLLNSAGSAVAAIESSNAISADFSYDFVTSSVPVWFDALNSAPFGNVPLNTALPIEHHITYAPVIANAGLASVVFTSTWLLCGYFNEAFQYKNTIECSTHRAITVAGKSWMFTSILMIFLAWGSDVGVGCVDCLHKTVGLTRADTTYIFDSLTVLILWRFTISVLWGYNDDNSNK